MKNKLKPNRICSNLEHHCLFSTELFLFDGYTSSQDSCGRLSSAPSCIRNPFVSDSIVCKCENTKGHLTREATPPAVRRPTGRHFLRDLFLTGIITEPSRDTKKWQETKGNGLVHATEDITSVSR